MSKIEQAIVFINNFLSGSDQSESTALRQAVTIYAAACCEVNKDLHQCRKLIDRGLLPDARQYACSMQPDLSSRCRTLLLPEKKLKHLQELCRLYNYEIPPEIDQQTLDELSKADDSGTAAMQELIRRWRKNARTGSNVEKIRILRAILAASPTDKAIWHNNLLAVEKQFTAQLTAEAETAMQSGDYDKLNNIFTALSSPELLNPTPPGVLEKFRPAVIEYQKKQLCAELDNKCRELFAAYSSLNHDLTRRLMNEYDRLCTNPLHEPDTAAEQSVSEVRNYLDEIAAANRKQQEFDRLYGELLAAIDRRADFPEIENIYAALRRTDLPVDMVLNKRVEFLRQEYMSEKSRTHIRKCIYGISLALLLAGIGVLTFILLQSYRSSRSYCETMERLIAAGNYQAVQELHTKISNESPMLLKFGRLNGLLLESLRLEKAQKARFMKIDKILAECERELSSTKPQLTELQHYLKNIDTEKNDDLPANSAMRLQKIRFEVRKLQLNDQQQAEQKFLTALRQLNHSLDELDRQLQSRSIDQPTAEKKFSAVDRSASMLFAAPGNITAQLLQSSQKLFQQRKGEVSERMQQTAKIQQLEKTLYGAQHFTAYAEALDKLPAAAPLLADGIWREALRNLPRARMLNNSTVLNLNIKHTGELAEICGKHNIDMFSNPAAADLHNILPVNKTSEQVKGFVLRMNTDYTALYHCRELVLRTFDNKLYRFYTSEEPVVEKSRTSRIPKAIGMNVMLMPGTAGKFLPFKLTRMGEKIVIYPGKLEKVNMPKYFTGAANMPLTQPEIPEAEHSIFLKNLLSTLTAEQDSALLESAIITELQSLRLAEQMNIFARANLTYELLKLLTSTAPLYTNMATDAIKRLEPLCNKYAPLWYEVDAEVKYSTAAAELKGFFQKFDPLRWQKIYRFLLQSNHTNMSRGLIPGGIIVQKNGKEFTYCSFQEVPEPHELWIYQSGENQTDGGWYALPVKSIRSDISSLHKQLKLYHGAVFFVPLDGRNTAELADEIKKQAAQLNINNFNWPQNWPLNCR